LALSEQFNPKRNIPSGKANKEDETKSIGTAAKKRKT
jgi:hypothetical protein